MKCVPRETKEFECFYLKKNNIDEFIKWLNKNSNYNYNYKYEYLDSYEDYIKIYYEELSFDLYLNRWYIWKDFLYDYDEDVFNQIYRMI